VQFDMADPEFPAALVECPSPSCAERRGHASLSRSAGSVAATPTSSPTTRARRRP
jgi:hypothetical protein